MEGIVYAENHDEEEEEILSCHRQTPSGNKRNYICDFSRGGLNVRACKRAFKPPRLKSQKGRVGLSKSVSPPIANYNYNIRKEEIFCSFCYSKSEIRKISMFTFDKADGAFYCLFIKVEQKCSGLLIGI